VIARCPVSSREPGSKVENRSAVDLWSVKNIFGPASADKMAGEIWNSNSMEHPGTVVDLEALGKL
jgi:hypothetical protein